MRGLFAIRMGFALLVIILVIIMNVSESFFLMPLVTLSLGFMIATFGISAYQKNKKPIAYLIFVFAAFCIYVAIQSVLG